MTIGEINRAIESKRRVIEYEERKKASYDYILADLIGRSVSRLYGSSNKLPEISQVYPSLFDSKEMEEQKQAKLDELSALRFKQFAKSNNERFRRCKTE